MRSITQGLLTFWCIAGGLFATFVTTATAEDFILADGRAWPGRVLAANDRAERPLFVRDGRQSQELTPRVQSLTTLADGRIIFCSGLDRSLIEVLARGERVFQHGGYLARQVRTDRDGTLYWSGLETPLENNPLPDGFIYKLNARGQTETVLTFSQGDVGKDWWGAFDVVDGRVFVGTLRGRTAIYDVSVSPVRHVCSLPVAVTAFRIARDGSIYACDGQGSLYRFADRSNTERFETVLRGRSPFVDFDFAR